MDNKVHALVNTVTSEQKCWTVNEILKEINSSRSKDWIDFDETDWRTGLEEHTSYRLVYHNDDFIIGTRILECLFEEYCFHLVDDEIPSFKTESAAQKYLEAKGVPINLIDDLYKIARRSNFGLVVLDSIHKEMS